MKDILLGTFALTGFAFTFWFWLMVGQILLIRFLVNIEWDISTIILFVVISPCPLLFACAYREIRKFGCGI